MVGYTQEIFRRYTKAWINTRTDAERENAIIFETNGGKVYNQIMSQMPALQRSLIA